MPKHLPTFKHLISSSFAAPKSNDKPDKSVNQLIASSRSSERPGFRDDPPHRVASTRGPAVWVPGAGDVSVLVACGMVGEAPIHPAELLRRSELARRQASRSVAGPVPPPSWRNGTASSLSSKSTLSTTKATPSEVRRITKYDLVQARALFARSGAGQSHLGASSLVEFCLNAVLLHLESGEEIYAEAGDEGMTIGEAMREQVGYLDSHLKVALLDAAGVRPDPPRLSDSSIRSILTQPLDEIDASPLSASSETDDWTTTPTAPPEIHHLPIILHLNPLPLLRQLPLLPSLSLTSLNLAYSTIKDLERLVTTLPGGLRELGLVGIRFVRQGKTSEEDVWKKGLALLGKKMILLRMLDLSFPTVPITTSALNALHTPERTQIPSLTMLGLRGISTSDLSTSPGLLSQNRRRWIEVIRDGDEFAL